MAVVIPASVIADSSDVPQISAAPTVFSCQSATKSMTMKSQRLCCARELSVPPLRRTGPIPDAVMSPPRGSGTPSGLRWQAIFSALESHREHEHRIVDARETSGQISRKGRGCTLPFLGSGSTFSPTSESDARCDEIQEQLEPNVPTFPASTRE